MTILFKKVFIFCSAGSSLLLGLSLGGAGLLSSCGLRPLTVGASLLLWSGGSRARGLSSCGVTLSCPTARGIFRTRDRITITPHCKADLATDHQGSLATTIINTATLQVR